MTRNLVAGLVALTWMMPGCSQADRQVVQNKEVVRQAHERVWSQGDLSAIDELYAADFVCHFLVGPEWRGREGVKEAVTNHRRSFPDWKEEIEDIIAEGDRVVTRFRSSGTHRGEFMGLKPTLKRTRIEGISILRMADHKIAEEWEVMDLYGAFKLMGAFPQVSETVTV